MQNTIFVRLSVMFFLIVHVFNAQAMLPNFPDRLRGVKEHLEKLRGSLDALKISLQTLKGELGKGGGGTTLTPEQERAALIAESLKKPAIVNLSNKLSKFTADQISELLGMFAGKNIVELNLSGNNITVLSPAIGNLKSLTKLNLANNKLTSLPVELCNLTNLEELDLTNDKETLSEDYVYLIALNLPDNCTIKYEFTNLISQSEIKVADLMKKLLENDTLEFTHFTGELSDEHFKKIINTIKKSNIRVLDLSSNKLKELPSEIFDCTSLTIINCSNNLIKAIKIPAKENNTLKILDLSTNQLDSLPEEIGNLKKLKELRLNNNQLIILPDTIGNLIELENLNLAKNQLTILSNEIGKLENLKHLNLRINEKTLLEPYVYLIALNLPSDCTIDYDFKKSNISATAITVKKLVEKLVKNNKLDLDYLSFELSDEHVKALINGINKLNIEALNLAHGQLKKFPLEILSCPSLKIIDCSHNQIKAIKIPAGNNDTLEELNLSNNGLTSLQSEMAFSMLIKLDLLGNNDLPNIDIYFMAISVPAECDVHFYSHIIKKNWNGKAKSLASSTRGLKLGKSGIIQLSDYYIEKLKLTTLPSIDLSNNNLTELPPEIFDCKSLKIIDCSNNKITAITIPERDNNTLEELNLSNNHLTSLPKGIENLKKLKVLDLTKNMNLTEADIYFMALNLPPDCVTQYTIAESGGGYKDRAIKGEDILSDHKLSLTGFGITALKNEYFDAIEKLKISQLDLSDNNLKVLPADIFKCSSLKKINCSKNGLTVIEIPEEVNSTLEELNLSQNKTLTSLPKEIERLKGLKSLIVLFGGLQSLPKEIGNLENLETLILSSNQLTSLPKEIENLKNLAKLTLINNQLKSLPMELGDLKNLKELYVSGNKDLPWIDICCVALSLRDDCIIKYTVGAETKEEEIKAEDLKKNFDPKKHSLSFNSLDITALRSDHIEAIKKLAISTLDLSLNKLKSLPREIGTLTKLNTINLRRNELVSLPSELGDLKNLTELDLSGNEKTLSEIDVYFIALNLPSTCKIKYNFAKLKFPKTVTMQTAGDLQKVFVDIDGNKLDFQDRGITELKPEYIDAIKRLGLSILNLSDNKLVKLPADIFKCANLTTIDCSYNKNLSIEIPAEVNNTLKDLNLKNTGLTLQSFPENIKYLEELTDLVLSENELLTLPPETVNLKKLKGLYLEGCKLITNDTTAALPKEIENLKELRILDLTKNYLQSLPSEIGKLEKLEELYLSENELKSLPSEIGNLKNLKRLLLSKNNALVALPTEIAGCINLERLELSGNKFTDKEKEAIKTSLSAQLNRATGKKLAISF